MRVSDASFGEFRNETDWACVMNVLQGEDGRVDVSAVRAAVDEGKICLQDTLGE